MTEFDPTGKIARRSPVGKPESRYNGVGGARKAQTAETVDRVTLSQKPEVKASDSKKTATATDIRYELVSKFRDYLEKGIYEVKADEIADKMVQKIRENKNRQII